MTTSGTTTFQPITDDILTEAWERCGLSPSILTGDVSRSARRSMQLMLLDWSNRAVPLWQVDRVDVVLLAGVGVFTPPAGTADVLDVLVRDVRGNDMMLGSIGRDEWAGLPNKVTRGRPNQYWVERTRDGPVVHLWPVPDRAVTISYNRFRLPQDVGTLGQSADVPVLWSEALTAGLAARLAVKYAPTRAVLLKQEAAEAYATASEEDRERTPFTVVPNMQGYR